MKNRSRSLFYHPSYRYSQLQNGNLQTAFEVHHSGKPSLVKSINEINSDIFEITMKIEDTFPELSKYIGEMPSAISDTGTGPINIQSLAEYYSSLAAFLSNYAMHHKQVK